MELRCASRFYSRLLRASGPTPKRATSERLMIITHGQSGSRETLLTGTESRRRVTCFSSHTEFCQLRFAVYFHESPGSEWARLSIIASFETSRVRAHFSEFRCLGSC